MTLTLLIIFWFACSILAYGLGMASMHHIWIGAEKYWLEKRRRHNRIFNFWLSLLGPFALFGILVVEGVHGWEL